MRRASGEEVSYASVSGVGQAVRQGHLCRMHYVCIAYAPSQVFIHGTGGDGEQRREALHALHNTRVRIYTAVLIDEHGIWG